MNPVGKRDLMNQRSSRKCSRCNKHGHNSRTCNANKQLQHQEQEGCIKLFGVPINKIPEHPENYAGKISSVGNLDLCSKNNNAEHRATNAEAAPGAGYMSEDNTRSSSDRHIEGSISRKRANPWTGEEHRKFLQGLSALGKGNWKGISKEFVGTRTSVQVASHAQKHFLRKLHRENQKPRRSVFDEPLLEGVNRTTTPTTSQVANLSWAQTAQGLPYHERARGAQGYPMDMNGLHLSFINMINAVRQRQTYENFRAWAPVPSQITTGAQSPLQSLESVTTRDFLNGNTHFC